MCLYIIIRILYTYVIIYIFHNDVVYVPTYDEFQSEIVVIYELYIIYYINKKEETMRKTDVYTYTMHRLQGLSGGSHKNKLLDITHTHTRIYKTCRGFLYYITITYL